METITRIMKKLIDLKAVEEGEKSEECENDYPACTWHPEMTCDEAKAERESGNSSP